MLITLRSGADFYLDGLIIETILSTFGARDLALLSAVCHSMRAPAQLAAHRSLVGLVRRMQCALLRHCERGSWITMLREWEALEAKNLVWLQAEDEHTTLATQGEQTFVKQAHDRSGSGHSATMHGRMPAYRYDAINGHPCFEFDGASVLKTAPFAQALPQPLTIMVVARARGDTTIFDALTSTCAPPSPRPPSRAAPKMHASCFAPDITVAACPILILEVMAPLFRPLSRRFLSISPPQIGPFRALPWLSIRLASLARDLHDRLRPGLVTSTLAARNVRLRPQTPPAPPTQRPQRRLSISWDRPRRRVTLGSTRGTGDWHIYTAIFDHRRSEIFVDGYCEASGKSVGGNGLDGLSIGCDHNGVFFLTGSLTELRLYHCHMATNQRVQAEAAMAHRYGIPYSSPPSPTPSSPTKSLSRFSCAPRSAARTSESY